MTKLYSKNLMGLNIDDFIHIEMCGFHNRLLEKGKKFESTEYRMNEK